MRYNNKNVLLPAPWVQPRPANDEIWYTSLDGNIVTPYSAAELPTIVSNTYSDGKGIIKFDTELTSIGKDAFRNRTGLTSVTISNSVTSTGRGAFGGCSGLTSVTIGNSVAILGEYTFEYCRGLTSVTIPNSIIVIDWYAFKNCSSLTSVTIGSSVTSIGKGTFIQCTGLTSISYLGTIAQWNAITKELYWHDSVPATVVHCTDGDAPI